MWGFCLPACHDISMAFARIVYAVWVAGWRISGFRVSSFFSLPWLLVGLEYVHVSGCWGGAVYFGTDVGNTRWIWVSFFFFFTSVNLLRYMAVVMGILEFGGWGSMFYDLA
jgi:hypothetical protein